MSSVRTISPIRLICPIRPSSPSVHSPLRPSAIRSSSPSCLSVSCPCAFQPMRPQVRPFLSYRVSSVRRSCILLSARPRSSALSGPKCTPTSSHTPLCRTCVRTENRISLLMSALRPSLSGSARLCFASPHRHHHVRHSCR